jgi:hypothetical protein
MRNSRLHPTERTKDDSHIEGESAWHSRKKICEAKRPQEKIYQYIYVKYLSSWLVLPKTPRGWQRVEHFSLGYMYKTAPTEKAVRHSRTAFFDELGRTSNRRFGKLSIRDFDWCTQLAQMSKTNELEHKTHFLRYLIFLMFVKKLDITSDLCGQTFTGRVDKNPTDLESSRQELSIAWLNSPRCQKQKS